MSDPVGSKPRRRATSFLGIHFDFHARDTGTPVGQFFDRNVVERIIDEVKPDYVQCDCKGHHGVASYPTLVGYPAPGLVGDPLRIWRDVTAEQGVALYVHFSGIYDEKAMELHPEWAVVDESGCLDQRHASVFGSYADQYLIPQLKELIDNYQIDGIWVDGECWATQPDYSPAALAGFRVATGLSDLPRDRSQPGYPEFAKFCRFAFLRYLRHYVDVLHEYQPNFQITSNWAFSSGMPEPVSANLDFLSGDAATDRSVRLEARCLAAQHMPWDIMTWSFAGRFELNGPNPGVSVKMVQQLQQEAATIIALGGGYQSVSNQKLDGSVIEWQLALMAEVGRFCRERERYCHRAHLVPQVGLLYSSSAFYRKATKLFGSTGEVDGLVGIMNSLLDSQNSVSILLEEQVAELANEFPLIVVPEWDYLPQLVIDQLLAYVAAGGRLLVVGARSLAPFERALDIHADGAAENDAIFWIEAEGWLSGQRAPRLRYNVGPSARPYGRVFEENDNSGAFLPAAAIAPVGAGLIAGVFFDFGARYCTAATPTARNFLQGLVRELFPDPLVKISGSGFVEVVLAEKNGQLIVHLVNTAGQQGNPRIAVFNEIPPIGPLQVRVRMPDVPKVVTLEPGASLPECRHADGMLTVTVPRLEVHTMVVVGEGRE